MKGCMRFEGKTAIVTGGSRGIGAAVVERLAAEGARVLMSDLLEEQGVNVEAQLRARGFDVRFMRADVTRSEDIEAIVSRAVKDFGTIDVLVNNAAVFQPAPFLKATREDLQTVLAVNVGGTFSVAQAVAKRMVAAGNAGAIVNMSSITAAQGSPAMVGYSGSKAAIVAMTRSMAVALSEFGIRVNAVAPGMIATENTAAINAQDPETHRQILSRTPLRRLGAPSEVAAAVAFLGSEDASYFTGQVIYPDGGRLALSYTVPVEAGA
jgi:NAD(P)-dependent dehydrogenase (short-subunit alcohol dehydrogenase family)